MIRTIIVIRELEKLNSNILWFIYIYIYIHLYRSKQMQELKNHEINFEIDLKSMEKESEHTKDFYGISPYVDKDKDKILEGI